MRKVKIIGTCIVMVVILAIFSTEIFAATYFNLSVTGSLKYVATEISGRIWGGFARADGEAIDFADAEAISFSSPVEGHIINEPNGNIIELSGEEQEYTDILADLGEEIVLNTTDSLIVYIFIKNTGDRFLVPWAQVETEGCVVEDESFFFDVSSVQDPLITKRGTTNMAYLQTIQTHIANGNAQPFQMNSTLDKLDVYLKRFTISCDPSHTGEHISFSIRMSFMADIDYTANDILHVYQTQNIASKEWTKYGYNATLDCASTRVEKNNIAALATQLTNANGQNVVQSINDDYHNAVVYRDIDIVNIDINTGEPIGRLSDMNYNFEWFGGRVSLEPGTTLASGRVLTTAETFTVDVYTYFPTMYLRRGVIGNDQWISLSDKPFVGSVKIDSYYQATFETTLFGPKIAANGDVTYYYLTPTGEVLRENGEVVYGITSASRVVEGVTYFSQIVSEVSYNEYGVIPRSYAYDYTPLLKDSVNYLMTNYLFEDNSGTQVLPATSPVTQTNMLAWANNLTQKWNASNLADHEGFLPKASLAEGENYRVYIYFWLYLIKYANNDTQSTVGVGNCGSYQNYKNKTVISPNGTITMNSNMKAMLETPKGGSTIGCLEYTNLNDAYEKNSAGYVYGYDYLDYLDTFTNNYVKKRGLYMHQFLTHTITTTNNTQKRVLLDGYVGVNSNTSVFCLGLSNPWGNIWKWVFGNIVNGNGSGEVYLWTTFDDYDTTNWLTTIPGVDLISGYLSTGNYNYHRMSYLLPFSYGYYRYLGTSIITGDDRQMLVGMVTKASYGGNNSNEGLCDYYHPKDAKINFFKANSAFGVVRGGGTWDSKESGLFYLRVGENVTMEDWDFGFRLQLV